MQQRALPLGVQRRVQAERGALRLHEVLAHEAAARGARADALAQVTAHQLGRTHAREAAPDRLLDPARQRGAVEGQLDDAVHVVGFPVAPGHLVQLRARRAPELRAAAHQLCGAHGVLLTARDRKLAALAGRLALRILRTLLREQRKQRLLRGVFVVCALKVEIHKMPSFFGGRPRPLGGAGGAPPAGLLWGKPPTMLLGGFLWSWPKKAPQTPKGKPLWVV